MKIYSFNPNEVEQVITESGMRERTYAEAVNLGLLHIHSNDPADGIEIWDEVENTLVYRFSTPESIDRFYKYLDKEL